MKEIICIAAGILGSGIAQVFGGWDAALTTLADEGGVHHA